MRSRLSGWRRGGIAGNCLTTAVSRGCLVGGLTCWGHSRWRHKTWSCDLLLSRVRNLANNRGPPRHVATSPRCSLPRDRRPTNQLSRACHVEQEGQDVWRQREIFVEWLRPFTTRLLHTCWTHFFNYFNLPIQERFFAYLQTGYVEVLRISICRVCTGVYLHPNRHARTPSHSSPSRQVSDR